MLNQTQLFYFSKVVEYGGVTKAAKELFISQPALSMAISSLEAEVGAPLFDRGGKKLILNQSGELLLDYYNNLELQTEITLRRIRQLGINEPPVTVGITATGFIKDVLQRYKLTTSATVNVIEADGRKIREMMKTGEVDIAMCIPPIDDIKLRSIPLLENHFTVAVPPGNHLYSKMTLCYEDIVTENFLGRPPQDCYRQLIDSMLKDEGMKLRYVDEDVLRISYRTFADYPYLMMLLHPPGELAKAFGISFKKVRELNKTYTMYLQYDESRLTTSAEKLIDFMKNRYYSLFVDALRNCETI